MSVVRNLLHNLSCLRLEIRRQASEQLLRLLFPLVCDVNINNIVNKPVAKQKNQKRKANEAIIGDTRFNIDKSRGIVVY